VRKGRNWRAKRIQTPQKTSAVIIHITVKCSLKLIAGCMDIDLEKRRWLKKQYLGSYGGSRISNK
jgi:hypothetical protein